MTFQKDLDQDASDRFARGGLPVLLIFSLMLWGLVPG